MDEPVHFTYGSVGEEKDLFQGDILEQTERINEVLKEVHPHFIKSKYNGFLVLTQTCDLVRRKKQPCKSRYINLAVIRPLEDVRSVLLDRVCGPVTIGGSKVEGVYRKESQLKAKQLMGRIINQNEQALGLFYLHPDVGVKIAEHSVALLQVSIAVRAHEHYDTLVDARCGRLNGEFRSKLGWLIGNLFSRIATRDWKKKDRDDLVSTLLGLSSQGTGVPQWIAEKNIKYATGAGVSVEEKTTAEVVDLLKKYRPKAAKDVAIEEVIGAIRNIGGEMTDEQIEKLETRLRNSQNFMAALK